jgi:hypothetical protein
MDEGQDACGRLPEGAQGGGQGFLEGVEGVMTAVAGDILQLVPEALGRIEFRTVGRRGQQVDVRRQAGGRFPAGGSPTGPG